MRSFGPGNWGDLMRPPAKGIKCALVLTASLPAAHGNTITARVSRSSPQVGHNAPTCATNAGWLLRKLPSEFSIALILDLTGYQDGNGCVRAGSLWLWGSVTFSVRKCPRSTFAKLRHNFLTNSMHFWQKIQNAIMTNFSQHFHCKQEYYTNISQLIDRVSCLLKLTIRRKLSCSQKITETRNKVFWNSFGLKSEWFDFHSCCWRTCSYFDNRKRVASCVWVSTLVQQPQKRRNSQTRYAWCLQHA